MTKTFLLIFTTLMIFSCNRTDKEILNKTITKLNSLNTVEYEVISEMNSSDRNIVDSAYCYFDFSSKDSLIGAKYQFISKSGENVFDGNQFFISNVENELVLHTKKPTKSRVLSPSFISKSIYEIRKVLPELVIDSTTAITRKKDTLINNNDCYKFKIKMKEKYIGQGGELTKFEGNKDVSFNYILLVSKKNYLPVQFRFIQPSNGYISATYSDIKEIAPKNDSIWDYDRMPRGYMRSTYTNYLKGMRTNQADKIGVNAPNWKLPAVQGDSIQLSKIKSLVLLEFWFPYCKGCVQAIPELNRINKKYKNKGLTTLGIEFTGKSEKILTEYLDKQKIEFPTLFMGKETSKEYEIYAAPTFFLIDKEGKIIYTSIGLNKEELIKEIENNI